MNFTYETIIKEIEMNNLEIVANSMADMMVAIREDPAGDQVGKFCGFMEAFNILMEGNEKKQVVIDYAFEIYNNKRKMGEAA
jgi:hypothetical protein